MRFSFISKTGALRCSLAAASMLGLLVITTGCGSSNASGPFATQPVSASQAQAQAEDPSSTPTVLLFNGTGTSSTDVTAVESVLTTLKLSYATKNSSQIESMTESGLAAYKLLIVPGGDSITIGNGLTSAATNNIHNAVINDGLHYLGICAGGYFGGYSEYNGLNLTSGVWFNTYANGGHGTGKAAVEISYPDGQPQLDQYWQDGPELNGWGEIVAKYPDGTSAIVEGASGKGWVVLSGIHPEAPSSWRIGMTFTTSVATDLAYANTLVTAALNGTTLSHY